MKKHIKALLAGALPVFVAATISRAVGSIIQILANEEIDVEIGLCFIYALLIAQIIGYCVTYFIPVDAVLNALCKLNFKVICIICL